MFRDHVREATELFKSGFHCSQSVFAVFSEEFGVSRDLALKIAAPFGGGLGGLGSTCGALTGALMIIGLKYGNTSPTDIDAKTRTRDKTRELIEMFRNAHGSCLCNDLIGFDRSGMSPVEIAAMLPQIHATCSKYVETIVSFLEEEL